jgi:ribosomal protein L7/L12
LESELIALRQRVAKLERTVEFLLQRFQVVYVDTPDNTAPPEIMELLRDGKKIEAIRVYREQTGVGLKEAKDFIDGLDR